MMYVKLWLQKAIPNYKATEIRTVGYKYVEKPELCGKAKLKTI